MRNIFSLVVAVTLLGGCGSDSSNDPNPGNATTVHCLVVDDICNAITGVMDSTQQTDIQSVCTGYYGGTFAAGPCPTTGAVAGHCHYGEAAVTAYSGVTIPGSSMDEYYYSAGAWTVPDAQSWCATPPSGTWVP